MMEDKFSRKRALILMMAEHVIRLEIAYKELWPMIDINMETSGMITKNLKEIKRAVTMFAFEEGTITGKELKGE